MANRNVFTADITDGQYQKGSYTTPEGNVRTGIHVFTTLSRSKQRVVPMVSTSQRVELSSMNPNSNIAAASDVIAKSMAMCFLAGPLALIMRAPMDAFILVLPYTTMAMRPSLLIPIQGPNTVLHSA